VTEPGTTVRSVQNCFLNSPAAVSAAGLSIAGVYAPGCPVRKSPPAENSRFAKYQAVYPRLVEAGMTYP
jgi:hypothetical protein